jgi:hypothetical protein
MATWKILTGIAFFAALGVAAIFVHEALWKAGTSGASPGAAPETSALPTQGVTSETGASPKAHGTLMPREQEVIRTLSTANVIYSMDGAGSSDLPNHEEIKALVDSCGGDILPVLVENLSNSQQSKARVDGRDKAVVSTGYVCFDLLCTIAEATDDWFIFGCGDDGIWAAVRAEYSVPMTIDAGNIEAVKKIQEHWKALLDAGKLRIKKDYASSFQP